MKLSPQALKQLIKEELEVILTDDEAAELFGDQLEHIIAEITKKVIPPEWARPGFEGYSKPFGSPYPKPGADLRGDWKLPTATQKHDWALRQRAEKEFGKRTAHLEKRAMLNYASQGDVRLFRQLRADAFEEAWAAEQKAAQDRLTQAVMSGADVKPPGANKAAARRRAHQIAKSKLKKSISKRVGAEEAEFLAKEIARFDASETPYTREWLKLRRAERAGRGPVPRGRPSWSPDPATLDPRIAAAEGANLSPDHLRRLRTGYGHTPGTFEGKHAYASPEAAKNYFRGVPGDPAFESPRITPRPAPEGYNPRGTTIPREYTGPPIPKGKSAAQKKALRRAAAKAALKTGAGFVGRRVLSPAMTAWLAHDAYSGGKWGQAAAARPSQLRRDMGLPGQSLIPGAPEYIQSGLGYEMSPDDPDYWAGPEPEAGETHPTKHKGGWGITDIDTSAPITKYVVSQLRGQPAPTPLKRTVGGKHVRAADDPEYLAQRQREREANVRAGGYDLDKASERTRAERDLADYVDTGKGERGRDLAAMQYEPNPFEKERLTRQFTRKHLRALHPETIKHHNTLEPIRRESLTPASLRQMVIEELGFGEGKPVDDEWSKKKTYIVEDEGEQLELPGLETPALCEPADGVDDLSSQLAQMVVDSGMPPEELNDLMGLIYDKVAVGLEGIGVEDEEGADDYRRTTMGFMEALKRETIKKTNEGWRDNLKFLKGKITGRDWKAGRVTAGGSTSRYLGGRTKFSPYVMDDETIDRGPRAGGWSRGTHPDGEHYVDISGAKEMAAERGQRRRRLRREAQEPTVATTAGQVPAHKEDAELDEKKQPSEKSAKKAHKALEKSAKKKFPKDKERQDRYIYGGKRKMGWKPKRERK